MGQFRYVTNRILADREGNEKGRIRIMVRTGSDQCEGDYTCPECSSKGRVNQIFKRPLNVRCESCGFLMKLPKLKK
jgi:transcription elongation factor Elf1